MRRIIAIVAVIAALFTAIAAPAQQKRGDQAPRRGEPQQKAKASKNLIVNGDLEDGGGKSPKGWSAVDGMMSSWGNEGNPGRCLVFDTSVLQVDKKKYLEAEEEFKGRGNTSKKNQYETVGAHEGVWAFSAPIDLKPDDQYFVLSADVWAPAKSSELFAPMIFIRGFTSVKADEAGQAGLLRFLEPLGFRAAR